LSTFPPLSSFRKLFFLWMIIIIRRREGGEEGRRELIMNMNMNQKVTDRLIDSSAFSHK